MTCKLIDHFGLELEHEIDLKKSVLAFEHAIKIYLNKPQVVNNWLAGSVQVSIDTVPEQIRTKLTGI